MPWLSATLTVRVWVCRGGEREDESGGRLYAVAGKQHCA